MIEHQGVLIGYSLENMRQEGLGADDKNGIFVALECLQKYDAIKVAFFVEEEIGCGGSSRCDIEFFKDVRFVIEPDRRDASDLITNIGMDDICSQEFLDDCGYQKFGYEPTSGLMTDVETLRNQGVDVSCINLSCGYHKPHTDCETTVISELENCFNFVCHIVDNCTKVYKFEHRNTFDIYDDGLFDNDDYEYIFNLFDYLDSKTLSSKAKTKTAIKEFCPNMKDSIFNEAYQDYMYYIGFGNDKASSFQYNFFDDELDNIKSI